MPAKGTYYDVLGITRAAPAEIIAAVWRAWMKALRAHPDLGGDEEFAKELNEAYEVLRNPESRAAYDAQLLRARGTDPGERSRRAPRVAVRCEIAYCVPPASVWGRALALDASALGVRVRLPESLAVGTHIAIAFPGRVAAAIEARVRWTREVAAPDGVSCEAGLEFFAPVPHILRLLRQEACVAGNSP